MDYSERYDYIDKKYSQLSYYDVFIEFKTKCQKLYDERKNYVFCLRSIPNEYDSLDEGMVDSLVSHFNRNLQKLDILKDKWNFYKYEYNHKFNQDFKEELQQSYVRMEMNPSRIITFMEQTNTEFEDIDFNQFGQISYQNQPETILEEKDYNLEYYENMNDTEFDIFMKREY